MELNRLTEKSQQALLEAQRLATRAGHTEVDGEHLLPALLDQPGGVAERLLPGCGADAGELRAGRADRPARRAAGHLGQPGGRL